MVMSAKGSFVLDQPIEPNSLVDSIVDRLETAIISGELKGGVRLSEQALAAQFGVSRSPLREALRRLEGRRLIECKPNIGARVAMLRPEDLEEVLAVREFLEALACRLAATNMSDAEIRTLEHAVKDRRQSAKAAANPGKFGDYDFHTRIIYGSGNKTLIDIMLRDVYFLMKVHRYHTARSPKRSKNAPLEHQVIIAALKARDPDAAEKAMRKHVSNAHASIRRELQEAKAQQTAKPGKSRARQAANRKKRA